GNQRRDAGEVAISQLWKPGAVNLVAVAIINPQAGAVFFGIDREGAEIDKAVEPVRPPRLPLPRVMPPGQRRDELRQRGVAKPLVIGPMLRKADRIVRAGLDRDRHRAIDPREQPRLEIGGAHLVMGGPADQSQDRQQHQPAQHTDTVQQQTAESAPHRNSWLLSLLATSRIETHEPSQYVVGNGHVRRSFSQNYPGAVPDGT